MKRKLFCEISPFTYAISERKCIITRSIRNLLINKTFAKSRQTDSLEYVVCRHNSLIRRRLGNVDMRLQENKAVNLSIAAPKINNVIICPGEIYRIKVDRTTGNHIEKKLIRKNHAQVLYDTGNLPIIQQYDEASD